MFSRKQRILIITLLMFYQFIFLVGNAQEIKKKKENHNSYSEEYYVLKEDKSIRHGQYLKFKKSPLDKKILVETGLYTNNVKTGIWYTFYSLGSLKSVGSYKNGSKQGVWEECYRKKNENIFSPFIGITHSASLNDQGELTVNKEDIKLSAEGFYHLGQKVGEWKYFSYLGELIQVYDHSKNEIISSSIRSDFYWPYLGGPDRLYSLYSNEKSEIQLELKKIVLSSEVTLELKSNDAENYFEIISQKGDKNFADEVIKILTAVPQDWFCLQTKAESVIVLIINIDVESGFFSIKFE